MLLLFRFLELEAGRIMIDGVDISKVKLAEVRMQHTTQDSAICSLLL